MTKAEITEVNKILDYAKEVNSVAYKALKKLIEQQPCTDAISRQAVLDINESHHGQMPNNINHRIWEEIKELPPVTPAEEQKPCEDAPDINAGNIYECSCGYGWDKTKVVRHHFCPNCGRAVTK
jgi:hypothetical protein